MGTSLCENWENASSLLALFFPLCVKNLHTPAEILEERVFSHREIVSGALRRSLSGRRGRRAACFSRLRRSRVESVASKQLMWARAKTIDLILEVRGRRVESLGGVKAFPVLPASRRA